jgi:hypothetical protein
MEIRNRGIWRAGAALLLAWSVAACTDTQEAPSLIGPSGLAQSMTLTASPDRIAHNGSAQSVLTVTMRDETGQPMSGQRVSVGATAGSISHLDVVTSSDGSATFVVTAPPLSTPASEVVVFATPFGSNAQSALTRTATIALTGALNATRPTASFTSAPSAPKAGDTVVLDASATTDEGEPCGDFCTYAWSFSPSMGGGGSSGIVLARTGVAAGSYVVTLTVVDDAGTVASTQRVVTVVP